VPRRSHQPEADSERVTARVNRARARATVGPPGPIPSRQALDPAVTVICQPEGILVPHDITEYDFRISIIVMISDIMHVIV
jgi:hypothetical protein